MNMSTYKRIKIHPITRVTYQLNGLNHRDTPWYLKPVIATATRCRTMPAAALLPGLKRTASGPGELVEVKVLSPVLIEYTECLMPSNENLMYIMRLMLSEKI